MALDHQPTFKFQTRHLTVGFMVSVSIILAAVLMIILQFAAFNTPFKWDLTSSGINSLSQASRAVIENLGGEKIYLTSLYFETDLEKDAQKKYRKTVNDILRLYQSYSPTLIETAWINPLQQQNEYGEFLSRLRELPKFKEETGPYRQVIEKFQNEIHPKFRSQMQAFVAELSSLSRGGLSSGGSETAMIERAVNSWIKLADDTAEEITDANRRNLVHHSSLLQQVTGFYSQAGEKMSFFATAFVEEARSKETYPAEVKEILTRMQAELKPWIDLFQQEQSQSGNLPSLELDRLEETIQPDGNVLIVATSQSAKAIPFEEIWPVVNENPVTDKNDFAGRRFAGEAVLTPTILQLVQKEKSAVVFVRMGGQGLFGGGGPNPMMAQSGPLSALKHELEKLNFIVSEWDLGQQKEKPTLDPSAQKVIYIVLRPSPNVDPRSGMPMPSKLGPNERAALLDAITQGGRAIFFTGWEMFAPEYDYKAYLESKWGIEVDGKYLVITADPIGPGQWVLNRNSAAVFDTTYQKHQLTEGLSSQRTIFSRVTRLQQASTLPEGVTAEELAFAPLSEDIWAVDDVNALQQRYDNTKNSKGQSYVYKTELDQSGPFPLVYIATKENAKVAVLASSYEVISDPFIAMQTVLNFSDGKIANVRQAPGNFSLFVNLLHYLNDTTQWLNVGSPIDASRLVISQDQLTFWRAFSLAVWPAVALLGGCLVWYLRRG